MPNGSQGSWAAWERASAALVAIDAQLAQLAREHEMKISGAERPRPTRSLTWGWPIRRKLEIVLVDAGRLTYELRGYAFLDRSGRRSWKQEVLASDVAGKDLSRSICTIMEDARHRIEVWTEADLEDAGPVAGGEG